MSYWKIPEKNEETGKWDIEYSGYPDNPVVILFQFEDEETANTFYDNNSHLDMNDFADTDDDESLLRYDDEAYDETYNDLTKELDDGDTQVH